MNMIKQKLKNCERLEKQIVDLKNKYSGNRSILDMTQEEIVEFGRSYPYKQAESLKREFSEACEDLYRHINASKLLDLIGEE